MAKETTTAGKPVATGDITSPTDLVKTAPLSGAMSPEDVMNSAAFDKIAVAATEIGGEVEQVGEGEALKWIDLPQFTNNPVAAAGANILVGKRDSTTAEVKVNGGGFAGLLKGLFELPAREDDKTAELNSDGERVRYFYKIQLSYPCPVVFKDENQVTIKTILPAGETVAIGERFQLSQAWRKLCLESDGQYWFAVRPHSKTKTGKGTNTMWRFDIYRQEMKSPTVIKGEVVSRPQAQLSA